MRMTPALVVIGGLLIFWSSVWVAVFLPALTINEQPSASWQDFQNRQEVRGHELYIKNGCSYCHSQMVRVLDWDAGSERISEKGDYYRFHPIILGTERIGPDLAQEGGEHPDDWHIAHFSNPRYTRPVSLMPSWEFLGKHDVEVLTAYVQSLGGKDATLRMDRQLKWRQPAQQAYAGGPVVNIAWLHEQVPPPWRPMPNPYPATTGELERGKKIYQQECVNCHGVMGDGNGPAKPFMNPPPLNLTTLRGHLVEGKYIGGIFYYQIMNGITGTAMPYFKRDLESDKIWAVGNYVASSFLGYNDAGIEPRGIPAAYEPVWHNPFMPPATQGAPK